MKITLEQCMESQQALQILSGVFSQKNENAELNFGWKDRYKLGRIITDVNRECADLNKQKDELIRAFNYQVKDAQGNEVWAIPPDKVAEANAQWAELLSTEVTTWGDPFDLTQWSDAKKDQLPVIVWEKLDWLLRVEEEAKTMEASG